MKAPLKELIESKKLIVCCGSGGVGKTTVSASIGLLAAKMGKRTLVLTIDPARRLATALGLDSLTSRPQLIHTPEKIPGSMHAAQLDTKRMFDKIIERFSPDAQTKETILQNPLYKQLSSMISGSQEYMAIEKIYELSVEEDWDIMVLDTPPTRNAMDFLDAPGRMVKAITDSMLKYFIRPSVFAGRIGTKAFGGVSKRLINTLGRFAGVQFIHEVFDLVSSTVSLLDGFKERALATEEILRKKTTTFLIVTSPRPAATADANSFREKIEENGLPLGGCIVNRVHPSFISNKKTLAKIEKEVISSGNQVALRLIENAKKYEKLSEVDRNEIDLLKAVIPHCMTIPLLPQDVCDLGGLELIIKNLTQ